MNHEQNNGLRFGHMGMICNHGDNSLDIMCPRCHSCMVKYKSNTLPPVYAGECMQCGFTIDVSDRKDPYKDLQQGEVSEIYNKKDHTLGDRVGW